jgi:predicted transcriptional regulator
LLVFHCHTSPNRLFFYDKITINRSFNSVEIKEAYCNENDIAFSLEVVDPTIEFYSMLFKWSFDKIESFYKESKIKSIIRSSSVEKSFDISWLDSFFKYYNDKKEELTQNLSSKHKFYLLQNEIYNEIERIICSYSNDYFRSGSILEMKTIQSCIQAWDGKLDESDIIRGTGIEVKTVQSMIKSLKDNGIIQEQENGRLYCIKRKFSNDAIRAMRERARRIAQ